MIYKSLTLYKKKYFKKLTWNNGGSLGCGWNPLSLQFAMNERP